MYVYSFNLEVIDVYILIVLKRNINLFSFCKKKLNKKKQHYIEIKI